MPAANARDPLSASYASSASAYWSAAGPALAAAFAAFRWHRTAIRWRTRRLALAVPFPDGWRHGFDTFMLGGGEPVCYANCDQSTMTPFLNVNDFICFQTKYAQGCP